MKRYEAYKDSGIEWIGRIPQDWSVSRLKFEVDMVLGKMLEDKEPKNNDGDYTLEPYLKSRNIGMLQLFNKLDELDRMWFNSKEKSIYELHDGDLVMNEGGDVGKVSLWKNTGFKCYIQNSVHKLTPHRDTLNSIFLQYLIFYITNKGYFNTVVNPISITHLTKEKLAETPILLPSLYEQQAIASYLDRKMEMIDASITSINTQIEELKSYQQSIISEAVTKGLNPNVPIKDSGVEWIGQIPKDWNIIKLAFLTNKIGSGKTPTGGAEVYTDDGVMFIRSQNVYNDGLITDNVSFISDEINNTMLNSKVEYQDVLLNITGGSIGRSCYISDININANVNQHVCIIRCKKEKLNPEFLHYLLVSTFIQNQIRACQTGSNRDELNFEQIGKFITTLPSLIEQKEIVKYLDSIISKIDVSVNSLENQRDDLNALKQSVISEAVTGQIDVRNFNNN